MTDATPKLYRDYRYERLTTAGMSHDEVMNLYDTEAKVHASMLAQWPKDSHIEYAVQRGGIVVTHPMNNRGHAEMVAAQWSDAEVVTRTVTDWAPVTS